MGRRKLTRSALFRAAAALLLGALVVLGVRLWVVEPVTVASDSMEPTVMQGSTLLVARWQPHAGASDVGRLVVLRSPEGGHSMLKRLVAVAGQTVAIRDGALFVDGAVVDEPWVEPRQVDGTFFRLAEVPAGHVFVLGDNRAASIDSRHFGTVPVQDLLGTVLWH
jgi:signal peptidase I